jgi:hypothetical protein
MLNGPYGYDEIFVNVPAFLDKLDLAELRRRAQERQPPRRG